MFWDLVQQSGIGNAQEKARAAERRTLTVERRLGLLEVEVKHTQDLLVRLIQRLEERFGEDLDGDGGVGTVDRPGPR